MYQRIQKLYSTEEIKESLPFFNKKQKDDFDKEIEAVFCGKSNKFLLIIGPCPADEKDAVRRYCAELKKISDLIHDKIIIIPRIYTTKPRSNPRAYRGMLHSAIEGEEDINKGIIFARTLMIDVANETGMFCADEMLYPDMYGYFDDLISYATIGARSSDDQYHRMAASACDIPVGIKNSLHGNLLDLAQGVAIASTENDFSYLGYEIKTTGNRFAHAILRGYFDESGEMHSNYEPRYVERYASICNELSVCENVIVDCNHFNSGKNYLKQCDIATETVKNLPNYKGRLKGLMIESYIFDGRQDTKKISGMSLTDACIGLEKTKTLIFDIASKL